MASPASYPWIAVVLPLLLAAAVLAVGRLSRALVPWVASLGPICVLGVAISSLAIPSGAPHASPWASAPASHGSLRWFAAGAHAFSVGWSVDSLAALMLVVVATVALAVMVFSVGYMHDDRGWNRYFALLSLFTGSMTLLVIANSFTTLFIGWELVGVCSYLLIGFWYEKPQAAAAAVKAFLTTRVGDVGLLIAIGLIWSSTGSLEYETVMGRVGALAPGLATAIAVGVAVGAVGKSAQFPLHAWLPDAMEGPTPISALIHAATMVAAGVYLTARVWPLFQAAPAARSVLLVAGTVSAAGAALAALAQRDIKKVLAYSTVSQLGFMFAALGVGAWAVAFFHLMMHAAFKALLFLTAGSVIHAAETNDLRRMGDLRRLMPLTFAAWGAGIGALAGIWPLAGFFSKDALLDAVWNVAPIAGVVLLATVFVTGVYSARASRLAFFGAFRGEGAVHESPASMLVPMAVLTLPAVAAGFAGAWLVARVGQQLEPLSIGLSVFAVALAVAGLATGWVLERGDLADEALESRFETPWNTLATAFRFDALVDRLIVRPTLSTTGWLWSFVDTKVVDGTVEGSAVFFRWLAGVGSRLQTGDAQWYGAVIAIGVATLLAVSVWAGR